MRVVRAALLSAIALLALPASGAAARVQLLRVGTFRAPLLVVAPPGDRERVLVVEQRGVVRVLRRGTKLAAPFLDIRGRVRAGGESGLLSLAFAPDYGRSRRFYVLYTDRRGWPTVEEFSRSRRSPDRALRGSGRRLLSQRHVTSNHKGGHLLFGPDRMLYVGLGDGGPQRDPQRRGQDLRTLLGKILRLDPRRRGRRAYRVPPDNPLADRTGVRREIWAYGVRNPWRFTFSERGSFVLADLGQNAVEEIDYLPPARPGRTARGPHNFGWSLFEGSRRLRPGPAPGHIPPVFEYSHRGAACGVIGGPVVRDRSLPGLRGRYLFGDFCAPALRSLELRAGGARGGRSIGLRVPGLTSFGEDARGRVYAASIRGGVYLLVPAEP